MPIRSVSTNLTLALFLLHIITQMPTNTLDQGATLAPVAMERLPDGEHDPPNIPEFDNGGAQPNRRIPEQSRLASPRRISWAEPAYTSREYREPDSGHSAEVGCYERGIDGLTRTLERTNYFQDVSQQSGEFTAQTIINRFTAETSQVWCSGLSLATRLTPW